MDFKTSQVRESQFADKLKGISEESRTPEDILEDARDSDSDDFMSNYGDLDDEESDFEVVEDPKRNFPTFIFSKKMKRKFYRAWKKLVIVKLLGKPIGYKALESRLQSIWAKRGLIRLIDIGHGFFIVKLSNKNDYDAALSGGPWVIYDHYLTVRPWEPKFNSAKATIDKVAVWVRFPNIFTEYYDDDALFVIGNRIRKTLKVDLNTSSHLRGHYVRVYVLVDLSKQFMSGFNLDGEYYLLEYEGLRLLCIKCGNYGLKAEECSNKRDAPKQSEDIDNGHNIRINDLEDGNEKEMMEEEIWRVI